MERGLSGRPTDCRYFRYLAPKGCCDGNHFWCLVGSNFGCVIASDTQFDSRVGFRVKLSDEDIAEIECQRVVAMATNFGTKIAINWLCVDDID